MLDFGLSLGTVDIYPLPLACVDSILSSLAQKLRSRSHHVILPGQPPSSLSPVPFVLSSYHFFLSLAPPINNVSSAVVVEETCCVGPLPAAVTHLAAWTSVKSTLRIRRKVETKCRGYSCALEWANPADVEVTPLH
ncbi:hypothetical protein Q5P01_019289 [Channa striata]|uniref:Uncharacterized protein n=1 Tax=Channa striata TaxID=64152 RepID=A0AA88M0T0_CHASR|nr:hypothetical protein Q5P01_019289 [Channa striata]